MMTHETQDYIQILHEHGYRVTPQRLIVLDAICEISGHADLGQITARVKYLDPTIDKSTVYRALDVLCAVGLVIETALDKQGKIYCIAGGSQHHHLTCQSCGCVLTVSGEEFQQFQQQMLAKYGFLIQSEHLAFKGLCKECQQ
jgi:Fur family transcriptional regulator, ferric uptake regulator